MAQVTIPPTDQARAVFERLGYSLSGDGPEFVAQRKWRSVRVTALCVEDAERPNDYLAGDGDLQCFVTWTECAAALRDRLASLSPDLDWAIVGVDDDGNHEVHMAA
jgi:hypothetical protein